MASSFCSDSSRLEEYARRAGQGRGPEACEVDVLDWPPGKYILCMEWKNGVDGTLCFILGLFSSSHNIAPSLRPYTVPALIQTQQPRLRIMYSRKSHYIYHDEASR